jgi:hypothetical protein
VGARSIKRRLRLMFSCNRLIFRCTTQAPPSGRRDPSPGLPMLDSTIADVNRVVGGRKADPNHLRWRRRGPSLRGETSA